jgi:hypothetical protein
MPCLRKSIDQLQRLQRFDQEGVAQSGSLSSVPSDSLVQLSLSRLQQADAYAYLLATAYFAMTSDKAKALISPRRKKRWL